MGELCWPWDVLRGIYPVLDPAVSSRKIPQELNVPSTAVTRISFVERVRVPACDLNPCGVLSAVGVNARTRRRASCPNQRVAPKPCRKHGHQQHSLNVYRTCGPVKIREEIPDPQNPPLLPLRHRFEGNHLPGELESLHWCPFPPPFPRWHASAASLLGCVSGVTARQTVKKAGSLQHPNITALSFLNARLRGALVCWQIR